MSFQRLFYVRFLLVLLLSLSAVSSASAEWKTRALKNVVYKEVDGKQIKLNLFLPEDENGNLRENAPLMIWLDSGCWYSGEPGGGGEWASFNPNQRGIALASVSTRSLTTDIFPAQIEDVKAAVRFLRAHAAEYHLDKTRFAVSGASSGGHLSLMLGMSDEFRLFDVGENLQESSQANVVIDFFGPADFSNLTVAVGYECIYLVLGDQTRQGRKVEDLSIGLLEKAKKYSPITYASEKYAPTLILHGTNDWIVPITHSAVFYQKLHSLGVRCQLYVQNGGEHKVQSLGEAGALHAMISEFIGWEELNQ